MLEKSLLHPVHLARLANLRGKIYGPLSELDCVGALSKEPLSAADDVSYVPIENGRVWAETFDCARFVFRGTVPNSAAGKHVVALLDFGGEGTASVEGRIVCGLTSRSHTDVDIIQPLTGKREVDLFEKAAGGEKVEIEVDAGFNGHFTGRMHKKVLAVRDDDAFRYYNKYAALFGVLLTRGKDGFVSDEACAETERALNESYKLSARSMSEAVAVLEALPPSEEERVFGVGHAHLDLAWLWPLRETRRKAVRTTATAVANLQKYPDYVFGASQAQMFAWIKEDAPQLFERIRECALPPHGGEARFEFQGGTWTECDCNLTSGESIIRQFYYGGQFFEREFGGAGDIVWLPDCFGFSAAMPQIFRGCGKKYFMTIKLSWNSVNSFPYDSFKWKGIDGTEIIAHMPPSGTYNSTITPLAVATARARRKQKDIDFALLPFGIGDGGGGPSETHISMAEVGRVVGVGMHPAQQFFEKLEKDYGDELPTFDGELYLEKHRGTYTSQAASKRNNRAMEHELHVLEWLGALAAVGGREYFSSRVDALWRETLLYQFHDILPGSSITRVYEENSKRYGAMLSEAADIRNSLLSDICGDAKLSCVNPIDCEREEYVKCGDEWYAARVGAYSAAALVKAEGDAALKCGADFIDNGVVRAEFKGGCIVSLKECASGKELCGGFLNKLIVYSDPPFDGMEAWDIYPHYRALPHRTLKASKCRSYVDGMSVVMECEYAFGNSFIAQKCVLTSGDRMVDFKTAVRWNESHKMLRTEFKPVEFSDVVNCDIQFGNVDRSTRDDTSIEKAQFEICAHKFVNVDGEDGGAAVMSDCKYGYRVKDGIISLNLLRAPKYPDNKCDIGKHVFSYAFYPHPTTWRDSDLVERAEAYDKQLIILDCMPDIKPLVAADGDGVIIETIKPSWDGKGIVARIYERYGRETSARISIGFRASGAYVCDMLERNHVKLEGAELKFAPYEIKTLYFPFGKVSRAEDNK